MEVKEENNQSEQWRLLAEEQKNSGLSQRAFCKEKNIKYEVFNYHLNSLRKKEIAKTSPGLFTAIQLKKTEPAIASEIRIVIPNGYQCYIPSQIDPVQFKRIMEVLLAC